MDNIRLKNQIIEGQTIELRGTDPVFLGPDLELVDCKIVCRLSAKNLILNKVVFKGCHFESKKQLKNMRFTNARISGCKFSGKFSGCDFGTIKKGFGNIVDSDFSESILDGCRFFSSKSENIKFPTWPNYTIIRPDFNSNKLLGVDWPDEIAFVMADCTKDAEELYAISDYAPIIVKEYGSSEESLKERLVKLSEFVVM